MSESILTSTKKALNLAEDDTSFDQDVILYINAVFSTLNQLGVGPVEGFSIEDKNPTWDAFLGSDSRLNHVKTYVYLRVRMLFDPPTLGYVISAMEDQIKELEWRINTQREDTQWTAPQPPPPPIDLFE